MIKQDVDYEWKPLFCTKCNNGWHECKEPVKKGPEKVDMVWKPLKLIQTTPTETTIDENTNVEQIQKEVASSSAQMDWIKVKISIKGKGVDTSEGRFTVDF